MAANVRRGGLKRSERRALKKCFVLQRVLPLVLLLLVSHVPVFAQDEGRWGDDLVIHLALIGPGDELNFWWGHVGLAVENTRTNHMVFYDWGVFSFDTENFFVDFAMGRPVFTTTVSPAWWSFYIYERTNRDVILYTLDLPPDIIEWIVLFAENNVLPENADYVYHHFFDNCSTRIRDLLDEALGGQLRARYGDAPARFTLRQHVRRHTWFSPFFDWILNFWMGQVIDRPITVWDEMFLPSELAKRLYSFNFVDADGNERPLVSSVQVIVQSENRPIVLDNPRLQWPRQLIFSLSFSLLLLLSYHLFKRKKAYRRFIGLLSSSLGLFFGIAGSMLFFLSFISDHDYTFENINILFVNPLFLAAIPLGITLGFSDNEKKRARAVRFLRLLWSYVFIGGFITIVIRILPQFYQQNHVTQALMLPLALTMVLLMLHFTVNPEVEKRD